MNARELLQLAERIANDGRADGAEYYRVEEEMLRVLYGLTTERIATVRKMTARGIIAADPGEEAVMADSPEWAAAVRLVMHYLQSVRLATAS